MLIGHAVERGMARFSEPTNTDRTTGHTISYFTVFFRIQHRIVRGKKSQAMGFNNTRTVRGIPRENHDFGDRFEIISIPYVLLHII